MVEGLELTDYVMAIEQLLLRRKSGALYTRLTPRINNRPLSAVCVSDIAKL